MDKIQIKFIKDAIDNPEKLSVWEYDFIYNISEFDNNYKLSKKQNAILNRISQKYLNGGW